MLILASGSPRRRELLTQIGVAYMVNPSSYHEESPKKKDPQKYVQDQALGKARDVAQNSRASGPRRRYHRRPRWRHDGQAQERDGGHGNAARTVGQEAFRLYGHRLINDKKEYTKVVETKVWFRRLSEKEIKAYVASGEPLDKAGAYGIQAGLRLSSIRSMVPIPTSSACPCPRYASCSTKPRSMYERPFPQPRCL